MAVFGNWTLPANWYIATIAKIIIETRIVDQQKIADWQTQLFAYASAGGQDYGAGKKFTYLKDKTNPKIARPNIGSLTPSGDQADINTANAYAYRNKKEFFEEIIEVDTPKTTYVTFDIAATVNQSFENSTHIAEYNQLIFDSNEYTIQDDYSEILLDMWNKDAAVQTTQTKSVDTYDIAAITDPSVKQWAYQQNSIAIKIAVDELLEDMTTKTTKYTDEATQATQLKQSEIRALFNGDWIRAIAAGGVQMYNPEAINYMLPDLDRIKIPAEKVANKKE